jgi:enamine deaminase RidA (YjgF/YER057c/UK114 family)
LGADAEVDIDARVEALGWKLPGALVMPPGVELPFPWVNVRGSRAFVSGHAPQLPDGQLGLAGKVGRDLTLEQAYAAARLTGFAILGSLQRELGTLNRIRSWLRVFGMVNVAPGFNQTPAVINGFTDVIVELFGPERGRHARSAVGMAELPFDIPVEIEAEVEIVP